MRLALNLRPSTSTNSHTFCGSNLRVTLSGVSKISLDSARTNFNSLRTTSDSRVEAFPNEV
jgi:hypothetical protein